MSLLLALSSHEPIIYSITCDAGAYGITGSDVTFSFGRGLFCDSGEYVISGNAATLTYQSISGPTDWIIRARRRGRR